MQQARNADMWLVDKGVKPHFLIHDRDRKFPNEFRTFWKMEGVRCILIPLRSPKANAFAEAWIESHKRECLNFFMCFNIDQLDYIKTTWVTYYNMLRPHRRVGMTNEEAKLTCEIRGAKTGKIKGQILTAEKINSHNTFDKPEVVKPADFKGFDKTKEGFKATIL